MGQEVRLFKSEDRFSRADVSQFLRQLADKIEAGTVNLKQGTQEQHLEIPHHLVLEIQVEDEDKRARGIQHSLEIELKWFDDMAEAGPLELG